MPKIGEILVKSGIITHEQLNEAMKVQPHTGELLGRILIRMGFVDEKTLLTALAKQFDIPFINLKNVEIDPNAVKNVPVKFALHYKLMPIKFEGNTLTIAISNPLDMWPQEDIKLHLGFDVKTALACKDDIMEAVKRNYGIGAGTIEEILEKSAEGTVVEKKKQEETQEVAEVSDLEKSAEHASVIKLVDQLVTEAINARATDIHIEPYRNKVAVRYRVDGILYDVPVPEQIKYLYAAIISRIKIISRLDIVERRRPQDGRAKVKIRGRESDLRISIIPSLFGENVVIRILPTNLMLSLSDLGFDAQNREIVEKLIKKPYGIIFLTGPTGSGKTTTLYAALSTINTPKVKIVTIEDPAEYEVPGITQIQVNPALDLTFANALRSILRHDPDIIMVGEVRDLETAELAIRVALTGHLVFSTLHTNDAPSAVTRLIDMGIEPFLICSSVEAFIAQRLVRKICPKCKQEEPPDVAATYNPPSKEIKVFKGKGCEDCNYTGYQGRTAIYEILVLNEELREMIIRKASAGEIKKKAVSQGMRTLRDIGWDKINASITTAEEVFRVTELTKGDIL